MKTQIAKIKKAYIEGRLWVAIKSKLYPYFSIISTFFQSKPIFNIQLHTPEFNDIKTNEQERLIVERIFQSYKKMKESQSKAKDFYQPSTLWANQLKESYRPLFQAIEEDDIERFHYFLTNFGNWNKYTGVSANMLIRQFKNSFLSLFINFF